MSVESTVDAAVDTHGSTSWNKELRPGTEIAERWQIVRFIAAGGMGEVYEAHDRLVDAGVALKILRSGKANAHERLAREIQLARKVTHPNVCRIHDAGRHGSFSFLTMELLDGEPLSARIARGAMSVAEVRPLLDDLAAALDAAHAAGVVHRDFKPHNVMLVRRGDALRAVVTDFGIARSFEDDGGITITNDGEMIGTPAYMAPEQVSGKPVAPATDVYSFGLVVYEMLTATLPFDGTNAREVATARLTTAPRPPSELVPGLDPRWNDAILAALALEPASRPASAGAMLALLDAPRPSRRRRSLRRTATLAAIVISIVAVAIWISARRDERGPPHGTTAAQAMIDRDPETAREYYRKGSDAFAAGRYDEAITWFLRVDESQRTPAMIYNIGSAYRKKGDVNQAAYYLRRFLEMTDPSDVAGRARAEEFLREVEAKIDADGGVSPP